MDTSTPEKVNISLERLRIASAQMRKLEVEATPQNYTIWYEYFSGLNKPLNNEIEKYLAEGQDFTSKLCAQLYSDHLGTDTYKALSTLRSSIKKLIS